MPTNRQIFDNVMAAIVQLQIETTAEEIDLVKSCINVYI